MEILAFNSCPSLAEVWKSRLGELVGKDVNIIELSSETIDEIICSKSVALLVWPNYPSPEEAKMLCSAIDRISWVVALTDGKEVSSQAAYSFGVHDCFEIGMDPLCIVNRFKLLHHVDEQERRFSEAQHLMSIGSLAAGIAHEINTPIQYVGDNCRFVKDAAMDINEVLAACKNLIDAADSKSPATDFLQQKMDDADTEYLAEEIPSALAQTLEGVDRVSNIVRAMKGFAHPSQAEKTNINLGEAISNTVMVARNEWKYVAEVETQFDDSLTSVHCNAGEINQVLLNLIVNAAHAIEASTHEGCGSKGTISITTRSQPPHAEIEIADTGCGMSAETMTRIFDPFFTTKKAGKGTGQGLAISRKVIEKHGGSITVESQVGVGTKFLLRLPISKEEANAAKTKKELPMSEPSTV